MSTSAEVRDQPRKRPRDEDQAEETQLHTSKSSQSQNCPNKADHSNHQSDSSGEDDEDEWEDQESDKEEDDDDTNSQRHKNSKGKGPSSSSKSKKRSKDPALEEKLTANVKLLEIDNYEEVSDTWTDRYIDKLLASRKDLVNNRPTADVLAKAQVLQARYQRHKKLLCLIGHHSLQTLETAM